MRSSVPVMLGRPPPSKSAAGERTRIESTHPRAEQILSRARLPIPPRRCRKIREDFSPSFSTKFRSQHRMIFRRFRR